MNLQDIVTKNKKSVVVASIFFASSVYYGMIVTPEYTSTSSFVIKEISSEQQINAGLGLFTATNNNSTAPIVTDYIKSAALAKKILNSKKIKIKDHIIKSNKGLLGLNEDSTFERFQDKIQDLVTIKLDDSGSVYTLMTSAYAPTVAHSLNKDVLGEINVLVNRINQETANAKRLNAEKISENIKSELTVATKKLNEYQQQINSISPNVDIEVATKNIAAMESELLTVEARLSAKKAYLSDKTSEVKLLSQQAEAIKERLIIERNEVVSIDSIEQFNKLKFEVEMLSKSYQMALASSLNEKSEASKDGLVLLELSEPTIPEEVSYPSFGYHVLNSGTIIMAIIWLIQMAKNTITNKRNDDA